MNNPWLTQSINLACIYLLLVLFSVSMRVDLTSATPSWLIALVLLGRGISIFGVVYFTLRIVVQLIVPLFSKQPPAKTNK